MKFKKRRILFSEGEGDTGGGGQANGGDDGSTTPWSDSIPEVAREWDEVKNSPTQDDFYNQVADMRSHLGQSIRIPGPDAGAEDLSKFHAKLSEKVPGLVPSPDVDNPDSLNAMYDRLGRPEKFDDYKVPVVNGPDGKPIENLDMSMADALRPIAHKHGLSAKQFEGIVQEMTESNIPVIEAQIEAQKADAAALQTEWGAATKQNTDIVTNFLSKTEAPELLSKALEGNQMGSEVIKWLHGLATKTLGSSTDFMSDNSPGSTIMTPNEAAIRISEIRNNSAHPYNNPQDPAHESARKTMRELYEAKSPADGRSPAPGSQF